MNGFAAFLGRSLRGVRLVEFGALMVLLTMVLGVYLAKAAAGRERGDITSVQTQIDEEGKRLRLLQAEVAHLEEPGRLVRLSAQIGLQRTDAKHQGSPDELEHIAQSALIPEKDGNKASSGAAQPGLAGQTPTVVAQMSAQMSGKTGAPQ